MKQLNKLSIALVLTLVFIAIIASSCASKPGNVHRYKCPCGKTI